MKSPVSSVDRASRFERECVGSIPTRGIEFCSKCETIKHPNEFGWKDKAKGVRHSYCLDCQRQMSRAHYQKNKQAYLDRNNRRMQEVMARIDELKASTPCADCGQYFKSKITDFHHRDSGEKYKIVSQMRTKTTLPKILKEIAKCDLLCANCHRERTFYS